MTYLGLSPPWMGSRGLWTNVTETFPFTTGRISACKLACALDDVIQTASGSVVIFHSGTTIVVRGLAYHHEYVCHVLKDIVLCCHAEASLQYGTVRLCQRVVTTGRNFHQQNNTSVPGFSKAGRWYG